MPDLAESSLEYFDAPVYDDFWPSIDESRLEFGGQVATGPTGDGAAPVVTLVSPPNGSEIGPSTAVVIDVTDNTALGRVFVIADMPGVGREEIVYRGDRFGWQYAAQSSVVPIAGGIRLTIRRSAGWPAPPTFVSYAVDASGTTE